MSIALFHKVHAGVIMKMFDADEYPWLKLAYVRVFLGLPQI